MTRTIRGTGRRHWQATGYNWAFTDPDPVVQVPLDWRLASGGRLIGDPDDTVSPVAPWW